MIGDQFKLTTVLGRLQYVQLGKLSDIHPAFKQQKCCSNSLAGSTKTKTT